MAVEILFACISFCPSYPVAILLQSLLCHLAPSAVSTRIIVAKPAQNNRGRVYWESDEGRAKVMRTLRTFLFHFCVPMRTLTVFCIKPAEVTTALMARDDVCRVFCIARVAFCILAVSDL